MAPVGSRESLAAALASGADAVYFGIGGLNMRSRSSANFTFDDMEEIAATCAAAGVKSYLTVNTVLFDSDMEQMHAIVDRACSAGISAIIASDIAAIRYCRSKGMEVHISTQVNLTNTEAVRFYSQWADVMVLARELNLEQVGQIHRAIEEEPICGPAGKPVRLEMFCHGALCMAVSGKCYLSLHQMNSSANRGACTQICRRSYLLTDRETGEELAVDNQYIMSPKDLKTIHFLNKMVDAGVRVFKIEGAPVVRNMSPRWSMPTTRRCGHSATAPTARRRWRHGTSGWRVCSTVVSGTATIWASGWANGAAAMVPPPPAPSVMPPNAPAISPVWVWASSTLRLAR